MIEYFIIFCEQLLLANLKEENVTSGSIPENVVFPEKQTWESYLKVFF